MTETDTGRLLVEQLRAAGVTLWADSGKLRYRAVKGVMTPERQAVLREHKTAVLEYLARPAEPVGARGSSAASTDPFPLTEVQTAYLLGRSEAFRYGGVACHGYGELELGPLDRSRLERAWHQLIARHPMLRTVINADGTQRVLAEVPPFEVSEIDLAASGMDIDAVRDEMSHRVYPVGSWPMFDVKISHGSTDVLHFSIDFLIVDFVSTQILLDELVRLYRGQDPPPELALSFRDYLAEAERRQDSGRHERDRAYWADVVKSLPPAPDLPVGQRQPATRFRRHQASLPQDEWRAFQTAAAERGVTASVAVLAAYAEVISRWSRAQRFTLNLTLQNRQPLHPDAGRIVGDFTAVELLAVEPAVTLASRASAMQQRLWQDLDHRLCSGLEVMREVSRQQGPGAGLFPVVFTSSVGADPDADRRESGLNDLSWGITQTPQVWIDCQIAESKGGIRYNWDVREWVFPDSLVEEMFSSFSGLLLRMSAADDVWEAGAPVPTPASQLERRQAINAVTAPLPDNLLHEAVVAQALRTPDRLAVADHEGSLSYGELLSLAVTLADELSGAGLIVAVLMDKSRFQFVAVLGILLAGLAYLPLDIDQPPARRARILSDAGVHRVVTCGDVELPGQVHRTDLATITAAPLPQAPPDRIAAPDDLAYVIYTSGSTGAQKGVAVSHRSAVNTIIDINRRFAVTDQDRVLGLASLAFDLSVYDLFGPPSRGAALILSSGSRHASPAHWADLICQYQVSLWNSVPAHLQMLADYLDSSGSSEVLSLRLAMLSGDWIGVRLPDQIRARIPGLRVISLGGATEAAIWSIWHPIEEVDPDWRSIPYGKPLTNQAFHVLDQDLRPCPDWVPGELFIGGAGLAIGYLGDEAKTAERFIAHPALGRLYRTGDLGRYLPDGSIEFLGREDRQVKIRGHRIELAEVEEAVRAYEDVAAAVVVADQEYGLAAFVEPARRPPARTINLSPELAEAAAAGVTASVDLSRFRMHSRALDDASLASMASALATVASTGREPPERYRRLLRRWQRAIESAGLADSQATDDAWRSVRELNADDPRLIDYFESSAGQLSDQLLGVTDHLALLFPEGQLSVCEAVWAGPLACRWANRVVGDLVRQLAPSRLLEVGMGIGGTSAELLAALPEASCTLTDLSPVFVAGARDRFPARPGLRFASLDVTQDVRSQGFLPNSYEVIVAGDVLHACCDIPDVLGRLAELLVPGGWLILTEVTREHLPFMISLEFMLQIDFADQRKDGDDWFCTESQWQQLLADAGGSTVLSLPSSGTGIAAESGLRVFAVQFKADRAPVSESGLRRHLAHWLPAYMQPGHVQVVDALPLSQNGKIDQRVLRSWLPPLGTADTAVRESANELEATLAVIWAGVLNLPAVGTDQGFVALGGDSLLAARLAGRLREELSMTTPFDTVLHQVLEGPTIAEFAAWVAAREASGGRTGERDAEGQAGRQPAISIRNLGGSRTGDALVLIHDGTGTLDCYQSQLGALSGQARLGQLAGIELTEPGGYLQLEPEALVGRLADDYADALLDAGYLSIRMAGHGQGAILALEVARRLVEAGADVHRLVAVDPVVTGADDSPLAARLTEALTRWQPLAYAGDLTMAGAGDEQAADFFRRACLGLVDQAEDLVEALR